MTRIHAKGLVVSALFLALTTSIASASTVIDLTKAGATANETGAFGGNFIVQQTTIPSTGSEVIDSFVRLKAEGCERSVEGYNTDFRPLQFDEAKSPQLTHSLLLSDVPVVNIDGTNYRQFVLELGPGAGDKSKIVSLNQVQIFLRDSGDLGGAFTQFPVTKTTPPVIAFVDPFSSEVFQLNTNNPSFLQIKLNAALSSQSKPGNMFLYVRDDAFQTAIAGNPFLQDPANQYVYLYSQFGRPPGHWGSKVRFEEWGVLKSAPNPVPEPSTVALALTGLGTFGFVGLRRRRTSQA
ncbi:PEP-CTERM protein-sorting domain-containing protein [Singulisphaera sp. GP187]|nr:PEP-CTERM protein-sorting domain-containing protein [Singulisphaera sp. GP187]